MRALRTTVTVTVISIVLFEIAARLIPGIPARIARLEPERAWEDRFLEMMSHDRRIVFGGFHQPNATRGWTVAPNEHETVDGFTYTTNEHAFRSLTPYRRDSSKFTVLAIGDSFTFGIDTNDTATWPYLLQQQDPRLQVINLGIGGYGVDQMDVTLRETIDEYRPRLVVVAFISDDLRRDLLSFRDYAKPRFELRGGQLRLTNVPIGDPDTVIRDIQRRRSAWREHSYTYRLFAGLFRRLRGDSAADDAPLTGPPLRLAAGLLDDMRNVSRRDGAQFLVVYLSYADGLFDPDRPEDGEQFLRQYGQQHHVATLDTRPIFLGLHRHDWVRGHYQLRENTVVGRAIYTDVLPLLSSGQETRARRATHQPRR